MIIITSASLSLWVKVAAAATAVNGVCCEVENNTVSHMNEWRRPRLRPPTQVTRCNNTNTVAISRGAFVFPSLLIVVDVVGNRKVCNVRRLLLVASTQSDSANGGLKINSNCHVFVRSGLQSIWRLMPRTYGLIERTIIYDCPWDYDVETIPTVNSIHHQMNEN